MKLMNTVPKRSISLIAFSLALSLSVLPTATAQSSARSQDYLRDVIDLSDTLGKAHAMRVVCNGNADQYWRRYMVSLLELEAPFEGGLRRSMINSFNAGFSTARSENPVCDDGATSAEKAYAAEGRALTNKLATANIPGARLPEAGD